MLRVVTLLLVQASKHLYTHTLSILPPSHSTGTTRAAAPPVKLHAHHVSHYSPVHMFRTAPTGSLLVVTQNKFQGQNKVERARAAGAGVLVLLSASVRSDG